MTGSRWTERVNSVRRVGGLVAALWASASCGSSELETTLAEDALAAQSQPVQPASSTWRSVGGFTMVQQTVVSHQEPSVAGAAAPLRTVAQADWCGLAPWVEVSPVYFETVLPPAIIDLPLADAFDCLEPSASVRSDLFGARCVDVAFENLGDVPLHNVFAVITAATTHGHLAQPEPLPSDIASLEGSGDIPVFTLGAFHVGDLPVGETVYRRWAFLRPDGSQHTFSATLFAFFDEVCNDIDDDCDGEVDEGGVCDP